MNAGPVPALVLVSHALCPYVQRAAIVLAEKGVDFRRVDIDLADKPAWFLEVSPLGKTPVLLVDGRPVFESAVICEYLDETLLPRLHPAGALERAQERAWMEFGSAVLNAVASFYGAADDVRLEEARQLLTRRFAQLEEALAAEGPWFAGARFGLVDAVFGPVFRYFDTFEALGESFGLDAMHRVQAWRRALSQRTSVREAVSSDYPQRLERFLLARGSALSKRMEAARETSAA